MVASSGRVERPSRDDCHVLVLEEPHGELIRRPQPFRAASNSDARSNITRTLDGVISAKRSAGCAIDVTWQSLIRIDILSPIRSRDASQKARVVLRSDFRSA
ncbi:hypothetical protein GCM10009555_056190 [Acrocarpospora macrocephala]|uniref:Uncharacterized protein n=1 Tax=Acrocarpospora macrocephala TaxID=150177 RepID=A0A5M3WH80_9ACTN|nr:hypothetical protein Amac_020910 [Acrocarpospora macrocephala]